MQFSNFASDTDFINRAVRELMLRHGILDRQHSKKLSEILNLSYSQAHRIINGGEWTVRQLSVVAEYFNETLETLLIRGHEQQASFITEQRNADALDAILVIGSRQFACRVWIGDPLPDLPNDIDYVAVNINKGWRVFDVVACPDDTQKYKVEKLEVIVKQLDAPSIAIIDDDRNSADNLRDFLNEVGFRATAFYDSATVASAVQERQFDGFIIDWFLVEKTAEALIKLIRSSINQSAPIFLLTGELQTGRAHVSDVARVIRDFDVIYQDKPIKLPIIAAELSKALGH